MFKTPVEVCFQNAPKKVAGKPMEIAILVNIFFNQPAKMLKIKAKFSNDINAVSRYSKNLLLKSTKLMGNISTDINRYM